MTLWLANLSLPSAKSDIATIGGVGPQNQEGVFLIVRQYLEGEGNFTASAIDGILPAMLANITRTHS